MRKLVFAEEFIAVHVGSVLIDVLNIIAQYHCSGKHIEQLVDKKKYGTQGPNARIATRHGNKLSGLGPRKEIRINV